jgi:two-component system, OmpR family, sensor histidine kinase BaeS
MTNAAVVDTSPSESSVLTTWGFAVALATLGTAILWKASPGINWGVWIACVVAALFAVVRERYGSIGAPTLAAGLWTVVLAFGVAITTDGPRLALLLIATILLLAIALVSAGHSSLDVLQPSYALQAPFAALACVLAGASSEAKGTVRNARTPGFTSVVRAALFTVPLVAVLILLLAEADPVFAALRDGIGQLVPDDFVAKTVFFSILLGVTVGAYGSVQRGQLRAPQPTRSAGTTIGPLERRSVLTVLASTMWLFVISSTISLMKNPASKAGSGITYAEYVHRGFAELSVAATLVIGVVLLTRRSWVASDAWARRVALAALLGECGMIASAFVRVVNYEQAYGFTVQRIYAQAYMVLLACMSALLIVEIARRAQSSSFAYHSTSAALAVFAACVFWNTDAWIVHHNVDRYAHTGKLDVDYLTLGLSADATPALIASLPQLAPIQRAAVTSWLCSPDQRTHSRDTRWFAWNLRASRALAARRAWYLESQPNCAAPTSS